MQSRIKAPFLERNSSENRKLRLERKAERSSHGRLMTADEGKEIREYE